MKKKTEDIIISKPLPFNKLGDVNKKLEKYITRLKICSILNVSKTKI